MAAVLEFRSFRRGFRAQIVPRSTDLGAVRGDARKALEAKDSHDRLTRRTPMGFATKLDQSEKIYIPGPTREELLPLASLETHQRVIGNRDDLQTRREKVTVSPQRMALVEGIKEVGSRVKIGYEDGAVTLTKPEEFK